MTAPADKPKWHEEPLPEYLYRFIPLRTDDDRQRAEALVLRGQMRMSNPRRFNDPFDCLPIAKAPETRVARELAIKAAWRRNRGPKLSRDRKRQLTRGSDDMAKEVEASFRSIALETGIVCFSEKNDAVLMWSHYASNHTGIVVRFRTKHWPYMEFPVILKVEYSQNRPTIRMTTKGISHDQIVEAYTNKAIFWDYEKEWRLLVSGAADQAIIFPLECIDAVIMGLNVSHDDKQLVQSWTGGREQDLYIYEALQSPDKFELLIAPIGN